MSGMYAIRYDATLYKCHVAGIYNSINAHKNISMNLHKYESRPAVSNRISSLATFVASVMPK